MLLACLEREDVEALCRCDRCIRSVWGEEKARIVTAGETKRHSSQKMPVETMWRELKAVPALSFFTVTPFFSPHEARNNPSNPGFHKAVVLWTAVAGAFNRGVTQELDGLGR